MAKYVVSQRMATRRRTVIDLQSRTTFETFHASLREFADVTQAHVPDNENQRALILVEGDPRDVDAKRKEAPADVIIEPERLRQPCLFTAPTGAALVAPQLGLGASVDLTVRSAGVPLAAVSVTVIAVNLRLGITSSAFGTTDAAGLASIPYDPRLWRPTVAVVVPSSGLWSWWLNNPQQTLTVDLTVLPRTGPLGWWHELLGITKHNDHRGEGIKVGVADTGLGPNTALAHARTVGAFVAGKFDNMPNAGLDVGDHGTHVAGIIAAQPVAGSGDFAGIAPGVELIAARVYPGAAPPPAPEGAASNADIASAIDYLSGTEGVDLINLSLGGPAPSDVELDAIIAAIEAGSLVICSAGNTSGMPVLYPAAYAQAVAVSATGLAGAVPAGSLDSMAIPSNPAEFTSVGLYVAGFCNVGPEMTCTAPGVGIISTVPGNNGAPYAAMSGTSMAAPAVAAALATWLSQDAAYRRMPRGLERTQRAWQVLISTLRSLGLQQMYQGYGLASAWPG